MCLKIPYEHIIVDGGSTDDTLEIVKSYSNIKLIKQKERTGMYGAIHLGFSEAKYDYICWINCDDYIIPESYESFIKLTFDDDCSFASSNGFLYFQEKDSYQLVKSTRFLKLFLKKGMFPFSQPSVVFKRLLYFSIGGLDYDNFKICGDLDLFHRMASFPLSRFKYYNLNTTVFLKYGYSLGDLNSEKGFHEIESKGIISKFFLFYKILLKLFRISNI